MTKIIKNILLAVLISILTISLSGCSAVLEPQYAEEQAILCDVFDAVAENRSETAQGFEILAAMFGGGKVATALPDEEKVNRTQLIEWVLNASMLDGDNYTGYYVIYSVDIPKNDKKYALVSLTEFDSGRYEWKVEAIESSLSEIKSWLE